MNNVHGHIYPHAQQHEKNSGQWGRRPANCAQNTWSDTPALPPHLLNWTNPLVCVTSRPDSILKIPFKSQNWIAIKPPVSGSTYMGNIIIATGREKIYLSAFCTFNDLFTSSKSLSPWQSFSRNTERILNKSCDKEFGTSNKHYKGKIQALRIKLGL